ncbi:hypothetical protein S2M10_22730 [Sphingomonas sp. S2M10]|uniref:hypothetical protein n=1 Tax=Sphingomonas sp. S2M10 TaxID=2705010 RepID=UPI001456FABF|nr:hypothetical protein [Sphingomonas sp. S2M10]NLS27278.1 hypothetical protein [Sphingomonas sp. S2M10]
MVQATIEAGDRPKRNTPGDVRRALFKTHDGIVITRDGFEFDGTAKVILSIRTNEGNVHEAEVFDQERMRFVPVLAATLYGLRAMLRFSLSSSRQWRPADRRSRPSGSLRGSPPSPR